MEIIDHTSPQEYDQILSILPARVRQVVEPRIHQIEEIMLSADEQLMLKVDGLRVAYPVRLSQRDIDLCADRTGRPESTGRRGLDGTLNRVAMEYNNHDLVKLIHIRVARALEGVAEPLREVIEAAQGLAVIGPTGVGKTTLLRNIARLRAERLGSGLVILDSSNEITGDGDTPHPMMRGIRRIQVGDPRQQAPKLNRIIRNLGPDEILVDEVGYNEDVELLITAARLSVTVIATMHGQVLRDVLHNPRLQPLLGVYFNDHTGESLKRTDAVFSCAVEVRARGQYVVHDHLNEAVDALLRGEDPGGRPLGDWPTPPPGRVA